ncbi:hypothetical protein ABTY61_40325 [Kitasatospora sp. NPDC096128]|uniref:hypothetical protein n=1 Tax=Kitasatospora sp. NPDC096128 TaxID=3155547 RepID=UPI00331B0FD8
MQLGQHQARLVYTSAYDHLVTTGRVLGSDGRVSLYAHTSLARSVCEAAVRHNWLLDTSVDHETRLLRSAVALYSSELNRLKGVKEIPEGADHVAGKQREQLISACEADVIKLEGILASAGINSVLDRRRRKITTHLELSSGPRVPMQFETGPMMIKLLPESPSWYTIS